MKVRVWGAGIDREFEGEDLFVSQDGEFINVRKNGLVVAGFNSRDVSGWDSHGEPVGAMVITSEDLEKIHRRNKELRDELLELKLRHKQEREMDKQFSDSSQEKRKPFWRR